MDYICRSGGWAVHTRQPRQSILIVDLDEGLIHEKKSLFFRLVNYEPLLFITSLAKPTRYITLSRRQFFDLGRQLIPSYEESVNSVTVAANECISLTSSEPAKGLERRPAIENWMALASLEIFVIRNSDGSVATEPVIVFDNHNHRVNHADG